MAIAFVPLYIKFLGIEAYGLIGFYAMLQAGFQMFDLGLSQTMNREMARYSTMPNKAGEARDFVRTLELGYWTIGVTIGVGLSAAAPFITGHWLKAGMIPQNIVLRVIIIMGIVTAFQWPLSLYDGGLMGCQRQVLSNVIKISMATLSNCGAAIILWKISPTISAFFIWQIFVSALSVGLYTFFLWHSLPNTGGSPRFTPHLLRNVWRFTIGMGGLAILGIMSTQIDKVLLSKLVTLDMFGYYTLAGSVVSAVPVMLVIPIFNALFPRFTSLAITKDDTALKLLYHQGTQLMATLVLPVSALLAFFSYDILLLWTGSTKTAEMASPIISVLIVGMALNALMHLPYSLQISHGWTGLGLRLNTYTMVVQVPAIYFMTIHYGTVGAASVWAAINGIQLAIGVPLTHHRLLQGEMKRWFIEDIIPPVLATAVTVGLGRWFITSPMAPIKAIASLSCVLLVSLLAAAMVTSHMREWVFVQLARVKSA